MPHQFQQLNQSFLAVKPSASRRMTGLESWVGKNVIVRWVWRRATEVATME